MATEQNEQPKSEQTVPEEQALEALFAEFENGSLELYRNVQDEPYVNCNCPEFPKLHRHMDDRDVRVWIASFVWEKLKIVLHKHQLSRILDVLAGFSLKWPRKQIEDRAVLSCLESDPVVAVIFEFMYDKPNHESKMEPLWKKLKGFAKERGLLTLGRSRFPAGPQVLSRKIREVRPVLKQLGITVEITRSDGSNVVLTRIADDCNGQASTDRPDSNPNDDRTLSPEDARQPLLEELRARRNQANLIDERSNP